jgi:beta-galactosidase
LKVSTARRGRGSIPGLRAIGFGGDYNPDQWPEDVWAEDVRLMGAAGVNRISLGIFSWARLEPTPGEYDFDWMDRLLALLADGGVSVNLATPTASPPPWLARLDPTSLPETADGVRLWPGSRRHYCPHNQTYRERAAAMARKLAERYGDQPTVAMWHVDNEYACHFAECFCDASAAAFRLWLEARYGTLVRLNEAWGTAFWSQHYGDWAEIQPPRTTPTFPNPTQQLDWRRFCSDSWLDCFDEQAAILREVGPEIPITTNFMGFHEPLDYWRWAAHEDVVSNDSYPDTSDPEWMIEGAMVSDLTRSLGAGRPWVLMEQAPGIVNWRDVNATKRPGVMRLGSYQAIARGADAVLFFQWRASVAGAEKFHSAMLPHGGVETRTWREISDLGGELARLGALVGSRVEADVAILFDWESWWALELPGKPSNALRFMPEVRRHYAALHRAGTTVDFAHPAADLSHYQLVVAPNLYLLEQPAIDNLQRFVEGGGTLVLGPFSGIVDGDEHVWPGAWPGALRSLLGLRIEEVAPLQVGERTSVRAADGREFPARTWAEVIRLEGAEPLAEFTADFYAGGPAIARRLVGDGQAIYVGTVLEDAGLEWLLEIAAAAAGFERNTRPLLGVEIVHRRTEHDRFQFILNYGASEVRAAIDAPGVDLLTGRECEGSVAVPAGGVAIVRSSLADA